MSKLDELIQQLCPNGVEWKPLGEVCTFQRGQTITAKDTSGGDIPVIAGGQKPAYYHNIANRTGKTITVAGSGAYAGYVAYWEIPIFVSDAFTIKPNNESLDIRYLFYFLKNIQDKIYGTKKGHGVPHVHATSINHFEIPLPPLPVQEEIVRILDKFIEFIEKQKEELNIRKEEYTYYVNHFLTFDSARTDVEWKTLAECCCLEKGSTPIQKAISGEYPLVVTSSLRKCCNTYQFDKPSVCVPLVSSRGHGVASLNQVYFQEGKFALGNILCAVTPKVENLTARYLYYYLNTYKDIKIVPLMTGGANVSLTVKKLSTVKICYPCKSEQQRIVDILDRFEKLTNDMTEGIPAEIETTQQMYEYYRNRLLDFKKKEE